MAHFAHINENNIVQNVIVVNNKELLNEDGLEEEAIGITFLNSIYGDGFTWIQTSYNKTFRKNFAGIGFTYDETRDAFISPQPYSSWTLNEDTCRWNAPVTYPEDNKIYEWNEEITNWELFITPKPYPSWIINEDTNHWKPPVAYPNDGKTYTWNEETTSWE